MKKIVVGLIVLVLLTSSLLVACAPTKPSGEIIFGMDDFINDTDPSYYSVEINQRQAELGVTLTATTLLPVGLEGREAVSFQLFPDGKSVVFMTFDSIASHQTRTQTDMAMITFDRSRGYETPVSYTSLEGEWLQIHGSVYPGPIILSDNVGYYEPSIDIYRVKNPGELPTLLWTVNNPFPTDTECGNWDTVAPSPDGKMVIWNAARFTGRCDGVWPDMSTGHHTNNSAVISKSKGVIYTFTETASAQDGYSTGVSYNWFEWSPDSKKIFYIEENCSEETRCYDIVEVFRVSNPTKLFCQDLNVSPARHVAWSPDSTKIVMLNNFRMIYVLDVQKPGVVVDVLESHDLPEYIGETSLVWSPDSEWIAFTLDLGEGLAGIYAVRYNGKDFMALDLNPEWSYARVKMPYLYAWWK